MLVSPAQGLAAEPPTAFESIVRKVYKKKWGLRLGCKVYSTRGSLKKNSVLSVSVQVQHLPEDSRRAPRRLREQARLHFYTYTYRPRVVHELLYTALRPLPASCPVRCQRAAAPTVRHQVMCSPPSTGSVTPVMSPLCSEQRNEILCAISSAAAHLGG